jgi:hypothetical protein
MQRFREFAAQNIAENACMTYKKTRTVIITVPVPRSEINSGTF